MPVPLYESSYLELLAALVSVYRALARLSAMLSTVEVSVPNLGWLLAMEAEDPSPREDWDPG